jgi:hypothetical protein
MGSPGHLRPPEGESMGYTYNDVDKLAEGKTPNVDSGECVDIVKELVPGLKGRPTSSWRAGAWVMEAGASIPRGTAIATFDKNGKFPQRRTGQHAALVLRVMPSGIWVVDQWRNNRGKITRRFLQIPIPRLQHNADGSFRDASNNPLAFRVIE